MNAIPMKSAIEKELRELPPSIAESPLAVLALHLAGMIDQGERIPECSRELRQCLGELRAATAGVPRNSTLDQLQAKRDQRRNA